MYHFIINPVARSKKGIKLWQTIEKYLTSQNIDYSYYFTNPNISTKEIIKKINQISKQTKKIIILGGDGTLNDVINALTDDQLDKTFIGYLPTGSSNDFARSMKISKDILANIKHILESDDHTYLDLGKLSTKDQEYRFVVSSGAGYDADICRKVSRSRSKPILNFLGIGQFVYILNAVTTLFQTPYTDATITIDDKKTIKLDTSFYIISMIQLYEGGGIKFAPDADPFDGKLSVSIAHSLSRPKIIKMLLHVLAGKHNKIKEIELFKCSSIEVNLDKKWPLHTDGEYLGNYKTFKVECLPKKLKLII